MNELKMIGFNELAIDEMLAVDGGGWRHDLANLVASGGLYVAGTAIKCTASAVKLSTAVTLGGGAYLISGIIYYNYKYAPRTAPKNRHHR